MEAKVYWIDVSLKKIQRANVDGSCVEDVVSDLPSPSALALQPGAKCQLLWSDLQLRRVLRRSAEPGEEEVEVLVEGLTAPTGSSLTLDGPRILWPDLSLKQICVAEPGGEAKALVKNLQSPNSVAVGDGQVYWGDFGTRKIHKLSTSGGSNEVIAPYGKNSTSLVVDTARGKLYWTNFGTNAIYRANLDGRDMQPLITDLESPSALALASKAGKLYWLERPRGKLRRASVEGSQVEDVLSNLPDPWALAVLDVGEAQVVPIEKYSWTDEGEVLKVYISESSNPAAVAAAGSAGCLLSVDFQPRGFTLTVRSDGPQFQLRILGLLQEVLPEKCKVRLSVGKRITLSLAKKDPKTAWSALCHRS
ncbi:unnamed protein product [Cladocopium goreaui]|uniref:CS domain-containing protein n=1 Tax=Cladocopium goreaui TaxID=2562237 RepID=A0A9P1GLH7_9DINO|nr:unnamed protein product [Cladocopium goreaui]